MLAVGLKTRKEAKNKHDKHDKNEIKREKSAAPAQEEKRLLTSFFLFSFLFCARTFPSVSSVLFRSHLTCLVYRVCVIMCASSTKWSN